MEYRGVRYAIRIGINKRLWQRRPIAVNLLTDNQPTYDPAMGTGLLCRVSAAA